MDITTQLSEGFNKIRVSNVVSILKQKWYEFWKKTIYYRSVALSIYVDGEKMFSATNSCGPSQSGCNSTNSAFTCIINK